MSEETSTWRKFYTKRVKDLLWLMIKGSLLVDGIFFAVFSMWLCGKSLLRLVDWLNKTVFA